MNIKTSSSTVQIKAGRKDQGQHLVPVFLGNENIEPSLKKSVTMPKEICPVAMNACRILLDGKILALDGRQQRLLLFSTDGIFMRIVVTFKSYPYDLCIVEKKFSSHLILNIKAISADCTYGTMDEKCTVVNLKDMSHKILEGVGGNCMSLFKENVYCTNAREHNVSCYKITGEPLWTYMYNGIKSPCGIALDINGFVYVASLGTNKIVVVSPDGKTSKTILSEANSIFIPVGIDINRDRGIMVVSCNTSDGRPNILVFKI
ncbi:unnamed protein product [Mytilus coruscus]|uniref:Uncharacterized protein n=1 Tax=Mytilus coruscus TaxID=42192 RepID=A0A6J7ZV48_MYTCO|nr:unnamed protein product [Mytilus coruscus]